MNPATLSAVHARVRAFAARFRTPLTMLAVIVFVGGAFISARELDFSKVRLLPVLINFLALGPAMFCLSVIGLQQLARLAGTRIAFRAAWRAMIYGGVAELLPVPGSAIARGAALVKSGAGFKNSAIVMAWSTAQTLGVAGTIGAVPIFLVYPAFGGALGAASVCVLAASVMWMARQTGNVLAIVAVKVAMVFGSALRAILGFAAIGHPIPPVKSLVFAIEGALTSIVGIVPAGIGVGEVFSAAMALTVAVAPAAAFLAKAVNRLIGLVFLGVLFTAERLSAARVPPPDAPPTGQS